MKIGTFFCLELGTVICGNLLFCCTHVSFPKKSPKFFPPKFFELTLAARQILCFFSTDVVGNVRLAIENNRKGRSTIHAPNCSESDWIIATLLQKRRFLPITILPKYRLEYASWFQSQILIICFLSLHVLHVNKSIAYLLVMKYCKFQQLFSSIVLQLALNSNSQLGGFDASGNSVFVDVDEGYFFRRKYHRW